VNALGEDRPKIEETTPFHSAMREQDELLRLVIDMLTESKPAEEEEYPSDLKESELFVQLCKIVSDIRLLSTALRKGDLQTFAYSKGFIISNLKALQSDLRHLTWQTKKLADGDFSQRVDFLGDFSSSFNIMAEKLEASSHQLRQLANTDTLTQLANRLPLDSFLRTAFEIARRDHGDLSVLMFDIDHFKRINDTYGHEAGDQVLIKVSHILKKAFRATDMLARYGGEEFVAVLPGCPVDKAAAIGGRAIKAVEETEIAISHEVSVRITVSGGVSEILQTDTNYSDVIKRSDAALYHAKQTGRNRICVLVKDALPI